MDFNIDFNLVRSQKLLLVPHLKQALDILSMNSQELFNYIEEQAESNPALEISLEEKLYYNEQQDDTDDILQDETQSTISLKEHLLIQLNALNLGKNQMMIGEYLIDNTDDNGYMNADLYEIAAFFNIPVFKVNEVLKMVQGFDPTGVCACNLKECLLIQLKQMEKVDYDAIMVVENYLNEIASNDISAVAEMTGLNEKRVADIFKEIKTLEPRPGRDFYKSDEADSVIADVIIRKINNSFETLINEDVFPDINIVENYKGIDIEEMENGAETYIQSNVNNAIWLIKCLEQRKNIMLKIAEKILKEQADFFEKGKKHLKSLNAKSFADSMDMHESILTKALNGKYIECCWGVFEMKYFLNQKDFSFFNLSAQ